MENVKKFSTACTLDDVGRIVIPSGLRQHLKWKEGDTLTTFANLKHRFIELFKKEGGHMSIDTYGRVTFTEDFLETMKWDKGDKIYIRPSKDGGLVLSLEEKYVQQCIFCDSEDIAVTINGIDVCTYHISEIADLQLSS